MDISPTTKQFSEILHDSEKSLSMLREGSKVYYMTSLYVTTYTYITISVLICNSHDLAIYQLYGYMIISPVYQLILKHIHTLPDKLREVIDIRTQIMIMNLLQLWTQWRMYDGEVLYKMNSYKTVVTDNKVYHYIQNSQSIQLPCQFAHHNSHIVHRLGL